MPDLQTLFGISLPIIQAPMAGVQDSVLAAAVSNAGGLGSLPAALLDADQLHLELAKLRTLTDKPFNVNFFCHHSPVRDLQSERDWRLRLDRYYQEFGITEDVPSGDGRQPFSAEIADLLTQARPAVVSFHFGLPEPALLAQVKATGASILSSATTVAEARWLEARGVNAIIAQGLEAGGHRGTFLDSDLSTQCGTFALLPQIVAAVRVPVIAAGGIADAAGVAAALRLGAAGIQAGTSFLLCSEATTSELHRAALREADQPTAVTNVFTGRPARGIVNRLMRETGPVNPLTPQFPRAANALAPLRRAAEARNDSGFTPLWSGQNRSGCASVPAAAVVASLAAGLAG